ncbi:hypothetical protein FHG66_02065 [Rubellimicrobium rubrum]|uniref:Uncharacterized protein n=1 Tax=Rubellimicrobium rubrum TaxID=2585369 RepID=A0A5C4N2A0_9RHOB|nr:hypothetical protein [Rubellimicrobium rubrum]TNC52349.1 hypothetical protein FHG66_02065 [Rubellimicrobium rubrum]
MRAKITRADSSRITVQISGKEKIFFDFGDAFSPALDDHSMSNFLVRTAFGAAMNDGADLEVDVPVDARLARNLEKFSTAWCQYRPWRFKKASRIAAPSYLHGEGNHEQSFVAAFSGGYDSSYMIEKYGRKNDLSPFPRIDSAVMIDGFGYNLENKSPYQRAFGTGSAFCSAVGDIKLHSVESNWSKIVGQYAILHVMGISAVLGLKSNVAGGGYVGLDFTAAEEFALGSWGNLDGNDRLFSSYDFEILPVGNDVPRISKIRHLRNIGLDGHIVVCNAENRVGSNCGACEKCLRTQLSYRALGMQPLDGQFEEPLTEEAASKLIIEKKTQLIFYKAIRRAWLDRSDVYFAIVKRLIKNAGPLH